MSDSSRSPFTVMEAGFRIIPGKEEEFFAQQGATVPVAMGQPGFAAVYGGPILDSTWLYFGVRFERASDMEAWQHHAHHREVQRMAYGKWWTDVYIRKWRRIEDGAADGDRFMCETRLRRATELQPAQFDALRAALEPLRAAGAKRFETLTGQHEPQPWQFVGPLQIAPSDDTVLYSLITHWESLGAALAWQRSQAYSALRFFGELDSEVFVAMPEAGHRERLREDRLQRQWTRPAP